MLVRVWHQLLDDRLEAVLPSLLPGGYGLAEVPRHESLLAEGERELLPFDGFQQKRRAQAGCPDRFAALGADGPGRGHTGGGRDLGQQVLPAQAASDLGIVRERQVGELAHLVPAAEHRLDVLVALGKEHRTAIVPGRAERFEQALFALDDPRASQVAGAQAELLLTQRDPVHRDPVAPEAAHDREPGVQEPEDNGSPAQT